VSIEKEALHRIVAQLSPPTASALATMPSGSSAHSRCKAMTCGPFAKAETA